MEIWRVRLVFCSTMLLHMACSAQEPPPSIRLETGGAARLPGDLLLQADRPSAFDPFYDLRTRQQGYAEEPDLQPTLLLDLPKSSFDSPGEYDSNLWSETLKGRVDAIAQPTSFSVSGATCQLGGSFADCMLPKLPCAFKLGVFGLGSQASHGPMIRDSYDFNILSSRCTL